MSPSIEYSEEQLDVINEEAKRLVVVACPGSGKTTTLVARVHRMIDMQGIDMETICVVTFTNAAANHIMRLLADEGIIVGFCGTLHALMLRWVCAWHEIQGMPRPGIMPQHEIKSLLTQINEDMRTKLPMKKIYEELAAYSAHGDTTRGLAGLVVSKYRQTLTQSGLYDYDALLILGRQYMGKIIADRARYEDMKFGGVSALLDLKHLFVDERQDSSRLDHAIYREMNPETETHVGDPDQAIYGFRGGSVESFVSLTKEAGVKILTLTRNFRSLQSICNAADTLVIGNKPRIARPPMVGRKEAKRALAPIVWGECDNRAAQQARVERGLANWREVGASNFAVLCRTNQQAADWRAYLLSVGIPVREREALPPGAAAGLGDALTWLALCSNPNSNLLAEMYLKANAHRVTKSVSEIVQDAKVNGHSINEAIRIVPDSAPFTPVRELLATHTPMHPESSILSELAARCGAMLDLTPGDLLAGLKNVPITELTAKDDRPGVTVTTMHGAKGMEWRFVVLPDWNAGTFPLPNAEEPEERRLAFVALTRARDSVMVLWCKETTSPWPPYRTSTGTPSPFVTACL